jgi:N(2)-fixation sustaining protein CowN
MSASQPRDTADRYVSFRDIDFDGNMKAVLGHLRRHIDDPAKNNALWDRFRARLAAAESGENAVADALLLLHSHVYYIAELFEENEDEEALAALRKLEEECF